MAAGGEASFHHLPTCRPAQNSCSRAVDLSGTVTVIVSTASLMQTLGQQHMQRVCKTVASRHNR